MHKCLLSPVLIALINTMLILPSAGRQGVRFGILLPELVMRLPGEQGSHTREGNRQGWADTRGRRKDDGGVEKGHQKAKAQRQRPELLRGTGL